MTEEPFSKAERASIIRRLRGMVDEMEKLPDNLWNKLILPSHHITIRTPDGSEEYELMIGMDRVRYGRDDDR